MKSIKSLYLAIVFCCLILTTCENRNHISNKNKENVNPKTLSEYLGKEISRNFNGIVLDENKIPVKDAIVSIGNKIVITDFIGSFKIKSANVNFNFAYLKVEKTGYKNTAKYITPNDSINEVLIVLQDENEPCLFWFCEHNHSLLNSNR